MDRFDEYLTFDDVTLVPQYNNVPSRLDPSLDTWLTRNHKISIPLVAANMDTVIGDQLADLLLKNGGIPLFHRFTSLEVQQGWVDKYQDKCFISCGLNDVDRTVSLLERGAKGVVIDIAHGHSDSMCRFIRHLKKQCPDKEIIAGNVCTPMGYQDLVTAGADAVKVGVGCGAACTTRIKTGFGVPQFSAIRKCSELARKLRVPIIADGGIVFEKDMVLALAAGASTVMMGSIFAKTLESAATKFTVTDPLTNKVETMVKYRGQASKDFQLDFYGSMKKGTVEEGISFNAKCTGSAQDVVDNFCGALRSALTYGGSKDIKELQRKAEFVKVTSNFIKESHPRPY
ncbi:GMP reductase [Acrasis kona]|uniref:GMP reductase n=1 Tax=Acrasis kona TaxID=1008807 RepID=A0AAW2ZEB1_9EUKA